MTEHFGAFKLPDDLQRSFPVSRQDTCAYGGEYPNPHTLTPDPAPTSTTISDRKIMVGKKILDHSVYNMPDIFL